MGLSKVLHTETVPFLRMKLPDSSSAAEETSRRAVLDSQTREPVEPLTRRRLPLARKLRLAEESTAASPAVQMVILLKVMAAKKVLGAPWLGMKEREKVLLGEFHDWLGFEAERDAPGKISAAKMVEIEETERRRESNCSSWIEGLSMFGELGGFCFPLLGDFSPSRLHNVILLSGFLRTLMAIEG